VAELLLVRRHCTHPVKRALLFFALLSVARADFFDDQFPQEPDILVRLIASAQASGAPLSSSLVENTTYYLRRAEYIGSCDASFGRVHAAQLFFIRSAPKDSTLPARGHAFVLFFNASFALRARWDLDMPLTDFAFEHTKLLLGRETLLDFARPPAHDTVIVDGKPQRVPHWTPLK
jgi:hypothetical protein